MIGCYSNAKSNMSLDVAINTIVHDTLEWCETLKYIMMWCLNIHILNILLDSSRFYVRIKNSLNRTYEEWNIKKII